MCVVESRDGELELVCDLVPCLSIPPLTYVTCTCVPGQGHRDQRFRSSEFAPK